MTSKEALESLMENYYEMCVIDNCNDDMYQKFNNSSERGIIEKDLDKLSQLEEIEEELGIDLITLFKAQKQGYIWELVFAYYDENRKSTYKPRKQERWLGIDFRAKALIGKWIGYDFKDYGKTWALTKEELENGY